MSDAAFSAAVDAAEALAIELCEAPVHTASGLAIKPSSRSTASLKARGSSTTPKIPVRFAFGDECYSARIVDHDANRWSDVAHLYDPQRPLRGLIASLAQLVPELGPLVAVAAASPLTLPLDNDMADRNLHLVAEGIIAGRAY